MKKSGYAAICLLGLLIVLCGLLISREKKALRSMILSYDTANKTFTEELITINDTARTGKAAEALDGPLPPAREQTKLEPNRSSTSDDADMVVKNWSASVDRPPLNALIADSKNVIGDPQFLLDFAIIGYPKTGTTSMSMWLSGHPDIQIAKNEMQALRHGRVAQAIKSLYRLKPGNKYKHGYKSPFDVMNRGGALDSIRTYWPKTKLIVGVRNPVLWFESFYNYRLQRGVRMPEPYALLKRVVDGFSVSAANFHVYLARFGKVNMTSTPEHLQLRHEFPQVLKPLPPPMPNPVFLYDAEQLTDRNETRGSIFRRDVQEYIGVSIQLPEVVHANKGRKWPSKGGREYIDICDSQYDKLRGTLFNSATQASAWIRNYFLDAPGVHVSSREHLQGILESWTLDPCAKRTRTGTNARSGTGDGQNVTRKRH